MDTAAAYENAVANWHGGYDLEGDYTGEGEYDQNGNYVGSRPTEAIGQSEGIQSEKETDEASWRW